MDTEPRLDDNGNGSDLPELVRLRKGQWRNITTRLTREQIDLINKLIEAGLYGVSFQSVFDNALRALVQEHAALVEATAQYQLAYMQKQLQEQIAARSESLDLALAESLRSEPPDSNRPPDGTPLS